MIVSVDPLCENQDQTTIPPSCIYKLINTSEILEWKSVTLRL